MSSDSASEGLPIIADAAGSPLPPHLQSWLQRLPSEIDTIIDTVAHAGGGIWIVGGAVRDAFLHLDLELKDIDFAVSFTPQRMLELFPDAIDTGIEYGTLTLRGTSGGFYEATTLRTESEYRDGRRPEHVEFGTSLLGDLERRDFTFNAMAIDVRRGLLHDPYHGVRDLQQGRVRAVGQAYQRLAEDGLRILRAYRFLDRGKAGIWQFDAELAEALKQHRGMLSHVTNERIWMEWKKILAGENAADVIERMARDEVLDRFLPGQWRAQIHHFHAQNHHLTEDISALERFALLLCEHDSIAVTNSLKQLKLSKKERNRVETIHSRFGQVPNDTLAGLRLYRMIMGDRAEAHLKLEIVIRESGLQPEQLQETTPADIHKLIEKLNAVEPLAAGNDSLVDGHWIMQRTGMAKGRAVGRLKQWLHRLQIERDLKDEGQIEDVLCTLNWSNGDFEHWPKLEF